MNVEARDLSFAYTRSHKTINPLSFSLDSSETIAIVGSSGCGKSTLLRLLCGLLPNMTSQVVSGQVLVNGRNILTETAYWRSVRATGKLGFMFQDPSLLPNMTVEQNVYLPLRILGQSGKGQEIVSEYLHLTGLEKEKHKLPKQLSGGMKTRVALARTFVSGPELLLLDEPFTGLDVLWKARLYPELIKLKTRQKSTVILVTHDIFEAIFFSSRILVMGNSHLLGEVQIPNWQASHTYDEVITKHNTSFIQIRELMESYRDEVSA